MHRSSLTEWIPAVLVVALAALAILFGWFAEQIRVSRRMVRAVGGAERIGVNTDGKTGASSARPVFGQPLLRLLPASFGAAVGWALAGPMGVVIGVGGGAAVPLLRARRRARQREETLERDLAQLAATTSLALRSGLSITQALDFAGTELAGPISEPFEEFLEERRLGIPFDAALERFGAALGTDDARLFVLVMTVHTRSGGDLAGALEEVGSTIRHRIAVRRELRAASAQGRLSGAILGALPIGFFLVMAVTSGRQLGPIYRSTPGIAMVSAGLTLEGLAYLWIRRLLRIEV